MTTTPNAAPPSRLLPVLAGFLGLALALALAARAHAGRIWVDLEQPRSEQRVRGPVGLVEVRGRTGTGVPGQHDVVVLIDRSESTWLSSGMDVNENGRVGLDRDVRGIPHYALWTTDFGDTIIQAQLLAARRLVERLDPGVTRMGLLTFAGDVEVRAPLGSSSEALLAALDEVPPNPDTSGTSLFRALKEAVRVLLAAPQDPSVSRRRNIILLSDGLPTRPSPGATARRAALEGAERAASAGAKIYAFALGVDAAAQSDTFREMARRNGGELFLIDQPGDVLAYVPYISLTEIERITLDNLSTSAPARALRLFPDGSFDAFIPLAPGSNRLRLVVHAVDGTIHAVDRRVFFERTAGDTPAEKRALERPLRTLRIRTTETELAERARATRERLERERSLEIQTE